MHPIIPSGANSVNRGARASQRAASAWYDARGAAARDARSGHRRRMHAAGRDGGFSGWSSRSPGPRRRGASWRIGGPTGFGRARAHPGAPRRRARAALRRRRGGPGGRGGDGDRRADRSRALRRSTIAGAPSTSADITRCTRRLRATWTAAPARPAGGNLPTARRRSGGPCSTRRVARRDPEDVWDGVRRRSAAVPGRRIDRYILDEALALFARTDAWVVLGYRGWPGQPRGLDRYRRAPA